MKNIVIASLLISAVGLSQEEPAVQNPVDVQFESIITESNNFKEYKVVKESDLMDLRQTTATYVSRLNQRIEDLENDVALEKEAQLPLKQQLDAANSKVNVLETEKSSVSVLGMLIDKNVYSVIVWSIVAVLAIALITLFLRFKSSNATTQQAKSDLATAELELEELRSKSIEEKQRLGRQLQDERNKLSRLRTAN